MSMTTSFLELLAVVEGDLDGADAGLGSSPLACRMGAWTMRATSVQ